MFDILLTFAAGVLTITAPCVLLPLPIVLGGSVGQDHKYRPILIALGFSLTFTLLTVFLFYLTSAIGLTDEHKRLIGVVLLFVFGIILIFPSGFEKMTGRFSGVLTKASGIAAKNSSGWLGGIITGAIVGLIWAPCGGPIIAPILALILQQKEISFAFVRVAAFSIGASLPMMLVAYGGQALTTKIKGIARYSHVLQSIFGGIMILLSFAVYTGQDIAFTAWVTSALPNFNLESKLTPPPPDKSPASMETDRGENIRIPWINPVKAPEFTGIDHWLNVPNLTLQDLKGKVVLVDFWTYSCINCIRTLPYVTSWYEKYKDQGFVVVGIHSPEFSFEKETQNVETALKKYNITYPVGQDNSLLTWNAYSNQYWPAHYLIDKKGNVVYTHFGEGEYDVTESAIKALLGDTSPVSVNPAESVRSQSPEMYFGTNRLENLDSRQNPQSTEFTFPSTLNLNTFALKGSWNFNPEYTKLTSGNGTIRLRFKASKVFMVAKSDQPQNVKIYVDGKYLHDVDISGSSLYELARDVDTSVDHTLEIEIPRAGIEAYTFTFG